MRLICFLFILFLFSCKSHRDDKKATEPNTDIPENKLPIPQFKDPGYFGSLRNIPKENPITEKGVILGRWLFYDKNLSANNTVSCGSCHQQNKAFTDGRKLGIGIGGQQVTTNTMALHNQVWVMRHFWNGRAATLEDLTLEVLQNPKEMDIQLDVLVQKLKAIKMYPALFQQAFGTPDITPVRIAQAISQFVRTMVSSDSRFDRYKRGEIMLTTEELLGEKLFFQHPYPDQNLRGGNCGDCHLGLSTAGNQLEWFGFHNNGLDENPEEGLMAITGKSSDRGKFRAPSLRNIALTAPYMHDGRFTNLEEVINHYDQHIKVSATLDPLIIEASNELKFPGDPIFLYLTQQEKQAILSFLHTLTDTTFINNPAFSNPFEGK